LKATIKFNTQDFSPAWCVTREFNDQKHLNNFIEYIERTKGYTLDEVYKK